MVIKVWCDCGYPNLQLFLGPSENDLTTLCCVGELGESKSCCIWVGLVWEAVGPSENDLTTLCCVCVLGESKSCCIWVGLVWEPVD